MKENEKECVSPEGRVWDYSGAENLETATKLKEVVCVK